MQSVPSTSLGKKSHDNTAPQFQGSKSHSYQEKKSSAIKDNPSLGINTIHGHLSIGKNT